MLDFIFTSRFSVPFFIALYGVCLLGMRLLLLENADMFMKFLLVLFFSGTAILTWVIDIT